MILAQIYQTLYLLIVLFLTIHVMGKYSMAIQNYKNVGISAGAFPLIAIFVSLFIGLRPISGYFTDMYAYNLRYNRLLGIPFEFTWDTENYLFDNIAPLMASMGIDATFYFLLIAIIYISGIAWSAKKMFPNDMLLAFVMYLGALSTFSFGTNGIKAGAAASIFLVALAYRDSLKVCIPLLWVSLGFHHSMLAPIVAFVIAYFVRKPKWYLYGWIFCLLLAAAHITYFMSYFSGFTDEHGAQYLVDGVKNTVSGFRPDFILYSAIPIFFGYYLITKRYIQSEYYNFLWCTYTLTNCVFLICTYGTFINRIAYLSWLMYPFVLLYPVINVQWSDKWFQFKLLKRVVWWHLYFTLFMLLVYYGFLRS